MQTIPITNGSFENPPMAAPRGYSNIAPPGWTGHGGVFRPQIGLEAKSVPDGQQCAWLSNSKLLQDLGVACDPTANYMLNGSVGTQLDYGPVAQGYRISLLCDGIVFASTPLGAVLPAKADWQPFAISGKPNTSGHLSVMIECFSGELLVDNLEVTTDSTAPIQPPAPPPPNQYPTLPQADRDEAKRRMQVAIGSIVQLGHAAGWVNTYTDDDLKQYDSFNNYFTVSDQLATANPDFVKTNAAEQSGWMYLRTNVYYKTIVPANDPALVNQYNTDRAAFLKEVIEVEMKLPPLWGY